MIDLHSKPLEGIKYNRELPKDLKNYELLYQWVKEGDDPSRDLLAILKAIFDYNYVFNSYRLYEHTFNFLEVYNAINSETELDPVPFLIFLNGKNIFDNRIALELIKKYSNIIEPYVGMQALTNHLYISTKINPDAKSMNQHLSNYRYVDYFIDKYLKNNSDLDPIVKMVIDNYQYTRLDNPAINVLRNIIEKYSDHLDMDSLMMMIAKKPLLVVYCINNDLINFKSISSPEQLLNKAIEFKVTDLILTLIKQFDLSIITTLKKTLESQDELTSLSLINRKEIDINTKFEDGSTFLHKAFSAQIVLAILDGKNFDINHQDCKGNTALHQAILSGNIDVARTILKSSHPDLLIQNSEGKTAKILAAECGVEWLFEDEMLGLRYGPLNKNIFTYLFELLVKFAIHMPNNVELVEKDSLLYMNLFGFQINLSIVLKKANLSHVRLQPTDSAQYYSCLCCDADTDAKINSKFEEVISKNQLLSIFSDPTLTPYEVHTISEYTNTTYRHINRLLYAAAGRSKFDKKIDLKETFISIGFLASGLNKMIMQSPPPVVTRCESHIPEKEVSQRISSIKHGRDPHIAPAFMSSSYSSSYNSSENEEVYINTNADSSTGCFTIITNHQGLNVSHISQVPNEDEILISPTTLIFDSYRALPGSASNSENVIFKAKTINPLIFRDHPSKSDLDIFNNPYSAH